MRTFDLSPLLQSAIGFDDLFGLGQNRFGRGAKELTYPPYNIEKTEEDKYLISMALAGFTQDDLSITVEGDTLFIEGKTTEITENEGKNYLHKGIAKRAFERKFQLADTIKVLDANFENGLLNVVLEREIPEHKKPRKIDIKGDGPPVLEDKAA